MTLPAAVGELVAIGELIRTQDNRITDSPIFIVQQKRKICGVDADYTSHFEWIDPRDTSEVYDDAAKAERDAEREEEGLPPIEWIQVGYIEIWEFVTACFTEQGCKDYLARNGHNLRQPRIYAEGSYRNQEWRTVRSYLMSLSALTAEAGKGGVDALQEIRDAITQEPESCFGHSQVNYGSGIPRAYSVRENLLCLIDKHIERRLALSTATPAGEWVLVPREPTDEMLRVWLTHQEAAGGRSGGDTYPWMRALRSYKKMLAASPRGAQGEG
jgi:hypothetical protein